MVRRALTTFLCAFLWCGLAWAEPSGTVDPSASAPPSTPTDPAAAARESFVHGLESVHERRWEEAERWFQHSAELVPRASTLYNLALARFRLKRPEQSIETIDRLLRTSDADRDGKYRQYAQALRERALRELVVLEVRADPSTVLLKVDGVERPGSGPKRTVILPPGSHRLEASAAGHRPLHLTLRGEASQTLTTDVVLEELPVIRAPPETQYVSTKRPSRGEAPRSRKSPAPSGGGTGIDAHWVVLAASSALLVGAAVTGVVAWKADGDFVDACPSLAQCPKSARPLQSRAQDFAVASDVLLGLGLATGTVGGVLWWNSGRGKSPEGSAMIGVRFRGRL